MIVNEQRALEFFSFIYDRQLIYHKKEILKQPRPWTNDPILDKYLFCNVYREKDRGTKYLINRVLSKDYNLETKVFNTILYRFFNKSEFFDEYLSDVIDPFKFDFKQLEIEFDEMKKRKSSIFSSAYMICQVPVNKEHRWPDKHIQILFALEIIAKDITDFTNSIINAKTPEDVFNKLSEVKNFGAFTAYEVYCDLSYGVIRFSDNDFVNIGPGCIPTMSNIMGKELTQEEARDVCYWLRDNQSIYFNKLSEMYGKDWNLIACKESYHPYPNLSIRSIEHSGCEYRKYNNLASGKGKRRYYRGV